MRVKARRVFTARGEVLTTEAHDNCCAEGEEVSSVEVEVQHGTRCDICDEIIENDAGTAVAGGRDE